MKNPSSRRSWGSLVAPLVSRAVDAQVAAAGAVASFTERSYAKVKSSRVPETVRSAVVTGFRKAESAADEFLRRELTARDSAAESSAGQETTTGASSATQPAPAAADPAAADPVAAEGSSASSSEPDVELPIPDFSRLTVNGVRPRLANLSPDELEQLRDYEQAHAARSSLLGLLDRRIANAKAAPDPGSDAGSA